jgi:hypothetical protein
MAFVSLTVSSTLGLVAFRLLTRILLSHQLLQQRVLVRGTDLADVIIAYEGHHDTIPFRIVGFLDDVPVAQDHLPPGYDLCGKVNELLGIVEQLRPDIILVALTNMRGGLPVHDILECRFRGIQVEEWPSFFEKLTDKIVINSLRPGWLIFSDGPVKTLLTETIRRTVDVGLSLMGLILSAPVMALATLSIKVDSPGPVLFVRRGLARMARSLCFINSARCLSMNSDWACKGQRRRPRITRVGRPLRKIRPDETPQMFNVLRGDMSFIGPRPERPVFVNQLKEQIRSMSSALR